MKMKTYALLCQLTKRSDINLRPLALSIAYTADLLFVQQLPADELLVTKHIYPKVAVKLFKTPSAIARSVERCVNICWNSMSSEQKITYLGKDLDDIPSLKMFIIYLAHYVYYDQSYFSFISSFI